MLPVPDIWTPRVALSEVIQPVVTVEPPPATWTPVALVVVMRTFPTVWVLLSSKYAPNFLARLVVHTLLLPPSTYNVPVELVFFKALPTKFVISPM